MRDIYVRRQTPLCTYIQLVIDLPPLAVLVPPFLLMTWHQYTLSPSLLIISIIVFAMCSMSVSIDSSSPYYDFLLLSPNKASYTFQSDMNRASSKIPRSSVFYPSDPNTTFFSWSLPGTPCISRTRPTPRSPYSFPSIFHPHVVGSSTPVFPPLPTTHKHYPTFPDIKGKPRKTASTCDNICLKSTTDKHKRKKNHRRTADFSFRTVLTEGRFCPKLKFPDFPVFFSVFLRIFLLL